MREVVLDTETTGLDPADGHRIIEIGCIELVNHVPTGRDFHRYVNPERPIDADALVVHGITDEMLADKPRFAEVVDDLLAFIGDSRLVIHNAEFALRFLNHELKLIGRPPLACVDADNLRLARRRFPEAPASLDALCRRFGVDLSERDKHGALIDCRLLAAVYLELIGGRQPTLDVVVDLGAAGSTLVLERPHRPPRPHQPSPEELAAHAALLRDLKEPIWLSA